MPDNPVSVLDIGVLAGPELAAALLEAVGAANPAERRLTFLTRGPDTLAVVAPPQAGTAWLSGGG